MDRKFDLEEWLVKFAAVIIKIAQALPSTFAGNHLANQLIRSGTSPALNYAEAVGLIDENSQLIAIFVKSIETAKKNKITSTLKK